MAKGPTRNKKGQFVKGGRSAARKAGASGARRPKKRATAKVGAGAVPAAIGAGRKRGGRKSSKRSRAAKKAAATRRRNHEMRSRAAKKAARSRKRGRHHSREGASGVAAAGAGRRRGRKGGHKSSKRSLAAKKGWRKRKHGSGASASELRFRNERRGRRGEFRSTRRKPKHPHPMPTKAQVAKYVRKHGLTHIGQLHRVRENPIAPIDYAAAVGGGTVGLIGFFLIDVIIATNTVTANTGTSSATNMVPGYTETPSKGKIYNEFATAAPLWASYSSSIPWRLVAASLEIIAPWGVTMIPVVHKIDPLTTGLRVLSLGAGLGVAFKLVKDLGAKFLGNTAIGQRLFQPEIMAQRFYADTKAALAATPSQMLGPVQIAPNPSTGSAADLAPFTLVGAAGLGGGGRQQRKQIGAGNACCANCAQGLPCAKELPPDAQAAAQAAAAAAQAGASGAARQPPRDKPPQTRIAPKAQKNHYSNLED